MMMFYNFETAAAYARYLEFFSAEPARFWRLTGNELKVAELLLTAPTLQRYAGALDAQACTLDVPRLEGHSSPPKSTVERIMLWALVSLAAMPQLARAYVGVDPELNELFKLPSQDLAVVLAAIALRSGTS